MRRSRTSLAVFLARITSGGLLLLPEAISFTPEAFSPPTKPTTPRPCRSSSRISRLFYKSQSSKNNASSKKRPLPQTRWLRKATEDLLQAPTLSKGKWHQVVSLMNAWLDATPHERDAPLQVEALLKRLVDEKDDKHVVLDMNVYNTVLLAWTRAAIQFKNPVASQRARELLVTWQETYERSLNASQTHAIAPNAQSFRYVLNAVCRTEDTRYARRLHAWMSYLHKSRKNVAAEPRRKECLRILQAHAKAGEGPEAETFLHHIMKHTNHLQPDTLSTNVVLQAYAKRGGRRAAEEASRVLEQMTTTPDRWTFHNVICAWAASGMRSHAVSKVEDLLRQMEAQGEEAPQATLNAVMSTWVKTRNPAAVERTAELLQASPHPDVFCYNTHLHALALHAAIDKSHLKRAMEILEEMENSEDEDLITPEVPPNRFTYNIVIEAACRAQHAQLATSVLSKLVHREGVEPDTFSFNKVLAVLSKQKGGARTAEQLFSYMEQAYKSGVHPVAAPDACSLSSVTIALARSNDPRAAERASALVARWETDDELPNPNRICYNALIDCWAKSGAGTYAARQAESVLQQMQDRGIAPNLITFNAILNAWARSGTRCCARKAELYLNQMWELYHAGDKKVKPNDFSYNTVINAISKSKDERKAQKALQTLRRMDKLYRAGHTKARPNEVTYTAVLNSCAFPSAVLDARARRKALDVAMFTLQELQGSRYGQPNQITYGTFLKACAELLPDDETLLRTVVKQAFEQCCQDGQVGDMVLTHLRKAAPKDLYEELLADATTVHDLPAAWRKNLRNPQQRRRQPHQKKRKLRP